MGVASSYRILVGNSVFRDITAWIWGPKNQQLYAATSSVKCLMRSCLQFSVLTWICWLFCTERQRSRIEGAGKDLHSCRLHDGCRIHVCLYQHQDVLLLQSFTPCHMIPCLDVSLTKNCERWMDKEDNVVFVIHSFSLSSAIFTRKNVQARGQTFWDKSSKGWNVHNSLYPLVNSCVFEADLLKWLKVRNMIAIYMVWHGMIYSGDILICSLFCIECIFTSHIIVLWCSYGTLHTVTCK